MKGRTLTRELALGEAFDQWIADMQARVRSTTTDDFFAEAGDLVDDEVADYFYGEIASRVTTDALLIAIQFASHFGVTPASYFEFAELGGHVLPIYLRAFLLGLETGVNNESSLNDLFANAEEAIESLRGFLYETGAIITFTDIETDDDPFGFNERQEDE